MPSLKIILHADRVDEYLDEHNLTTGFVELDAVLLQHHGMQSGQPAVMFVAIVDGKRVLFKTSLRLLETTVAAMRAAANL